MILYKFNLFYCIIVLLHPFKMTDNDAGIAEIDEIVDPHAYRKTKTKKPTVEHAVPSCKDHRPVNAAGKVYEICGSTEDPTGLCSKCERVNAIGLTFLKQVALVYARWVLKNDYIEYELPREVVLKYVRFCAEQSHGECDPTKVFSEWPSFMPDAFAWYKRCKKLDHYKRPLTITDTALRRKRFPPSIKRPGCPPKVGPPT